MEKSFHNVPYKANIGLNMWSSVWPLLIFLFMQELFVFFYLFAIPIVFSFFSGSAPDMPAVLALLQEHTLLITMVINVTCLLIFLPCYVRDSKNIMQSEQPAAFSKYILIVISFIALNYALSVFMTLIDITRFFPDYADVEAVLSSGTPAMRLLCIGLIAPLVEEILFRGLLLNRLRRFIPAIPAVLLQAVLFGLIHRDPLQIIYAAPIGIFLGMLYIRFRSIWPPIIAHAAFNIINVLMVAQAETIDTTAIEEPSYAYTVVFFLVTSLVAAITLRLVFRRPKQRISKEDQF